MTASLVYGKWQAYKKVKKKLQIVLTNNFGDRKNGKTIEKGVVLLFKLTASHLRETAGFQKKRGLPYNWGGRKGFLLEEHKC